ncbi:MAG: hypothetical protein HQM03_08740 [Magnetococcales bacterium]|nr:hypothetical protein [Magnetococcales bacterium]
MIREMQTGEYDLNDPELLRQGMRLTRAVHLPGTSAILAPQYCPITEKLLDQLYDRGIETVFAEPIREQSVVASVEHMEKMFRAIDEVFQQGANSTIEEMSIALQFRRDQKALERLVRENLDEIGDLFTADPTEKLLALTRYHSGTGRHSIVSSFHMMALGRELGWPDDKVVRAAVAVFNHDVGKTKIKLETLDWPGRLDGEKWKEIQSHTLLGGLLLYRPDEPPSLLMLTALLHHEWYVALEGKGYGGLTIFADYFKQNLQLDIPRIVAALHPDDLEIIQASALVDMVSALEERRSYKKEQDAFKVLIIMNSDARLGHFNPVHFAAWHRIYQRQYPNLLPLGRRAALPREKEKRLFRQLPAKEVNGLPLLTYYELEQLGFLTVLRNVGMDVERIRRRGGLLLSVLEQMKHDKGLTFDCSRTALERAGIRLLKNQIVPEEEVIELDGWREWLTLEELERSELLASLRTFQFDLPSIRREKGISPARLTSRGVRISEQRLAKLGINPVKRWLIRLPATESRLTQQDLVKLGVSDARLRQAGCLERVRSVKSGVSMQWLAECGLTFAPGEFSRCGIDPIRKVFYDIQVTGEISSTRAKVIFLREGDDLQQIEALNEKRALDPIQQHLFHRIGEVVLDFTDLVAVPDLSHVAMGRHWGRGGISD